MRGDLHDLTFHAHYRKASRTRFSIRSLICVLIVAYLAALSIYTGQKSYLDVAIAYA
ncbi:hypothetical protein INQ17_24400, partial [Escherichia coli]|nr:hypothetical protein [Escherichia coli]